MSPKPPRSASPRAAAPGLEAATQDLVARVRACDLGARDELVRRLRPHLLDRIEVMMGAGARRYAESHDIAQSVVVDVIRDLDKFTPGGRGSLLRWACQIARNHICDEVRRKHERAFESLTIDSSSIAAGQSPSAAMNLEDRKERVADALVRLPHDYRLVVRLRYFEGMKFGAIAESMGRTENSVLMLHARALLRLGSFLRALDEGAGS